MITWCANNFGGTDKVRSVGMAFHIGMGSFGGAMGANFYTERTASGGFRLGHALNLGFVTMGGISVMALWISYRYVNNRREKLRRQRREKLEESVGAEKAAWKSKGEGSWEDREREMRRDWEVAREIELVELGSHSIWFVYTI